MRFRLWIRWCVSCLWSTASVLLHRLVTAPLPPITASKPSLKPAPKPRQAGTDHLHPEPKVECVVLHTPDTPSLDVIFVHGLYGSLGNTWRQGDWRSKYNLDPTKVPLRDHTSKPCNCHTKIEKPFNNVRYTYEMNLNESEINETVSFNEINGCFQKILPNENSLITEKFYDNTFINVSVNNYETQAEFVTELFKTDCNKNCDTFKCNLDENVNKCNCVNKCKCNINEHCKLNACNCKVNEQLESDKCEMGCGCVCDDCYSSCWPKDWIKEDFPGARVISINYTSDPYLWRPLWVKGNKRLRLHERAEQMMEQLLQLGVGERPIIWVGHSKGGLFIKQIYCEAFEAYTKINKNNTNRNSEDQSNNINLSYNLDDNYNNNYEENLDVTIENINEIAPRSNDINSDSGKIDENKNDTRNNNNILPEYGKMITDKITNIKGTHQNFNFVRYTKDKNTEICGCAIEDDVVDNKQARCESAEFIDMGIYNEIEKMNNFNTNEGTNDKEVMSSNCKEDIQTLQIRSSLWEQSAGFMFYSVPHRGSPLADIKTPITARSIELLEISKDCQLVLELQDRWLIATEPSQPAVSSLVETCRTLMSVLWLRIVSVDSADAGVGSLHGVSVDHREICKPSSRRCLLYTELTGLIRNALKKCHCKIDQQL